MQVRFAAGVVQWISRARFTGATPRLAPQSFCPQHRPFRNASVDSEEVGTSTMRAAHRRIRIAKTDRMIQKETMRKQAVSVLLHLDAVDDGRVTTVFGRHTMQQ